MPEPRMELTGTAEMPEVGDATLVSRARTGDRAAFAILIEQRADRLLRTARAILRNEAEAHDAAQQTLVSAWVHLPKLRDPDRFDAWLNRSLVNACRETLRRRGRSREVDLETSAGTLADHAASALETISVRAAFARLSVEDRHVLLLHHLEGLPLAALARQLGLPVGTAKSRLWRARQALERALEAEA
jgi:RNA polymerase sigma-70 factor (ECF subfamily)